MSWRRTCCRSQMLLGICTRNIIRNKTLIEKMGKEIEGTLNYREKCWTGSLDMINNNLIKMYSAQGEFEGILNSIRRRQNDLIKKMALSMEWSTFNRSEESSRSK